MISGVLEERPEIGEIRTAGNGQIGLNKISHQMPDVVTLDIDMPVMNGLQTLSEIRRLYPKLPVIMLSSQTQEGAAATLDALSLGASDYIAKPADGGSFKESASQLGQDLMASIKTCCAAVRKVSAPTQSAGSAYSVSSPGTRRSTPVNSTIRAIAIGVSTGGPNALAELIPALPAGLKVPVVIVQHMPPVFTKSLADRLNAISDLQISEAIEGDPMSPGRVYVAPGGYHLELDRSTVVPTVRLTSGEKENSCRPAVDVMFRSMSDAYKQGLLGIVLTGMGKDGQLGAQYIRDAGGRVIAQDEASSTVWGMPRAVVEVDAADDVLPLNQIAHRVNEIVGHKSRIQKQLVSGAV